MGSYGTVPASEEAAPTPRVTQGGSGRRVRRIAGALAMAAVVCAAAVSGVALHRRMVLLGCDSITCAMNTPTAPPGTFASEPRVLSPEEVDKLKAALEVEQSLENQVLLRTSPFLVPTSSTGSASRSRPRQLFSTRISGARSVVDMHHLADPAETQRRATDFTRPPTRERRERERERERL
jgi:hypothetical protein